MLILKRFDTTTPPNAYQHSAHLILGHAVVQYELGRLDHCGHQPGRGRAAELPHAPHQVPDQLRARGLRAHSHPLLGQEPRRGLHRNAAVLVPRERAHQVPAALAAQQALAHRGRHLPRHGDVRPALVRHLFGRRERQALQFRVRPQGRVLGERAQSGEFEQFHLRPRRPGEATRQVVQRRQARHWHRGERNVGRRQRFVASRHRLRVHS